MLRLVILVFLSLPAVCCMGKESVCDVAVWGATPAGIAAALSAADAGYDVLLVEPTSRIGGLLTNGLSHSDFRSFESLSGFYLDFSQRVAAYYTATYGADSDQLQDSFRGTHGEPSVNLRVLQAMLNERPRIRVMRQTDLVSVELSGYAAGRRRIVSALFMPALQVTAQMFIDASYEGDLMAMAGENFHIGRESRKQYGEAMAGNTQGHADGQVQGYNFRLIMTDNPSNQLMPSEPRGYSRADFVGVLPHFESQKLTKVFSDGHDGIYRAHAPGLPNRKSDVNDTPHGPIRLSMPDINDAYPAGDARTRADIVRQHRYYNLGLLYFLQNDHAVPPEIQSDARRFGLCKDEFEETSGIPDQLYIREARRMVGQHVFTAGDTQQVEGDARAVLRTDSIACGDYVHNCHGTGRIGTRYDGQHAGEFYKPVPPYQIAYGVIVPAKTTNLLVPVACSASHFGFGALRLEPIWSSLGQAAGEAAALAIDSAVIVQDVDIARLQSRLHAQRSATIYVSDVGPDSPDYAAVQWFGTRGGLHGLAGADQPKAASLGGQYSEAHPGHLAELDKPIDRDTYERWSKLATLPDFKPQLTRRDAIRFAYQAYRVAVVRRMSGLVAFWDFVKREALDEWRFVAHVPEGVENTYPLDAANYVEEFWGQGRKASYDDFPLLGRGPFGQAIQIRQEQDATFRPLLFIPRARLQDTPLDIKGSGKSVSVVVWAIRESGNHALAGIWHEGTDLRQDSTNTIQKIERGQRQYALFAGLNKAGSACGHLSENGASSFLNRYALHKCNSLDQSPEVPADSPFELLDGSWQCFCMTFDDDRNELVGWLNGFAGDRWQENPKQAGLLASAYTAYMQGYLHRLPGKQTGEDATFPQDQYYNPPEVRLLSTEILSQQGSERVELREYRYTKLRVTLRDGQEISRDLVALRLNPWWYPHGIYVPPETAGGPFTIGRVIHSSRSVGFTGWIGGVAVFDRALEANEVKRLSEFRAAPVLSE